MTSPVPSSFRLLLPLLLCATLLGLGLSGCSYGSSESPPLPDSTVSRMLVEMHLLSARAQRDEGVPPGAPDSLLRVYGLERQQLEEALRYYSRRPGRLDAIYDAVIDTLGALEQRSRYRSSAPPDVSPGDQPPPNK
jgi:hypothetical protein